MNGDRWKAFRALLWKDWRQQLPLWYLLLGIALLMAIMLAFQPGQARESIRDSGNLVLGLPLIFAVGIAPVLVCPERENRTLAWNLTLSAEPRQIIRSKVTVALVSLACAYLFSWLYALLLFQQPPLAAEHAGRPYVLWLLSGWFTVMAGFLTTWYFRNSFVALLVLLPVAFAPAVLGQLIIDIEPGLQQYTALVFILAWVFSIVVVQWLSRWAALRAMSPAANPQYGIPFDDIPGAGSGTASPSLLASNDGFVPARQHEPRRRAADRWAAQTARPWTSSLASLVWQSVRSAPLTWAGLALMVSIGTISLILLNSYQAKTGYGYRDAFNRDWLAAGMFVGYMGVSWLGVFAFTGDGSSKQMRFLADRGVSPRVAWYSRHAAALAWLALWLVIYGLLTLGWFGGTGRPDGRAIYSLSLLTMLLGVLAIYGISQWTAQMLRQLPASCAAAPFLSAIVAYWLFWTWFALGTPFWWCVVCGLAPWLVTWLLMRWHMEDLHQGRFLLAGAAALTLLILLPLLPPVYRYASYPRVASATLHQWQDDFKRLKRPGNPSFMQQPVRGIDMTIPMDAITVRMFLQQASLTKVNASLGEGDKGQATADLVSTLRRFSGSVQALRESGHWKSQQTADLLEIWMIATLDDPAFAEIRQSAELAAVRQSLADQAGRNAARRRAVLASWGNHWEVIHRATDKRHSSDVGGYDLTTFAGNFPIYLQERYHPLIANRLAKAAMALLDADSQTEQKAALHELHQLIAPSDVDFDQGPYRDAMRIQTFNQAYYSHHITDIPALQWGAGWEQLPQQWER